MKRYLSCLLLPLIFVGYARAESIDLLGNRFTFAVPSGYCSTSGDPLFAEWESRTRNAIGKDNRLLLMFANCKHLQEFRKGKRRVISDYGAFSVQTPKGILHTVTGATRPYVISSLIAKSDTSGALKRAETRAQQYIPGYSNESLGWLDSDSNGAYMGMLMTMDDTPAKPIKITGVGGITMVKQLIFGINLWLI